MLKIAKTSPPKPVTVNPTPEPSHYADAQIAAILDPSSKRDTVLITPGSAMPTNIPDGLHTGITSRGLVITKNKNKIQIIHEGDDKAVGQALFGYDHDQNNDAEHAVVAKNKAGVPVAELASSSDDLPNAVKAAGLLAPDSGSVSVKPRKQAVAERVASLLG
mgnify:CR=1 FL=1